MGDMPVWFNWLLLIVGVLLLLGDLETFTLGIDWSTWAFLLFGLAGVAQNQ